MAMLPLILSPDAYTSGPPLKFMVWMTALYASWTLIPITISCAILRRRLWDIDPIINRTLVYGLLSAIVVGFYVLVVAVLFQPLRDRLQKGVNRLLYGDRDDPYAVMTGLGRRPTVVTTIKDALRLPYVAIGLRQDGELQASCCWHPAPRASRSTPPTGADSTEGASTHGEAAHSDRGDPPDHRPAPEPAGPDRHHVRGRRLRLQRGVLHLIAKGSSNAEISRLLSLNARTVANYVSNILAKLQVADREEAIRRVREAGMEP